MTNNSNKVSRPNTDMVSKSSPTFSDVMDEITHAAEDVMWLSSMKRHIPLTKTELERLTARAEFLLITIKNY